MRLNLWQIGLAWAALWVAAPCGALDEDGDGMGDVWALRHGMTGASPGQDIDGDGMSNGDESRAGTDPRNPRSRFDLEDFGKRGARMSFTFGTEAGKAYRILFSADLRSTNWAPIGGTVMGVGGPMTTEVTLPGGGMGFCKVEVIDADTDGDGVPDWDERQMFGFRHDSGDSFGTGLTNNDLAAMRELLGAMRSNLVSASVLAPDAFEEGDVPGRVRVTRATSTQYPLTLFYSLQGDADPRRGAAGPSDYAIRDGASNLLAGKLVIPAGASSADLLVDPDPDSADEVPETLGVAFSGLGGTHITRVKDATTDPANSRLFVAYLTPVAGAQSSASGIATVRLQGDNAVGLVNITFSGLTSPQSSTQIRIKNPITGPDIESVPRGQVTDHAWDVTAAQFLVTDQAVLDALLAGQLYLQINTGDYPDGEIRGDFVAATGSTELQVPPPPPAIPQLVGDALDADIARFLTQATFGPTPALMAELRALVSSNGGDRIAAYGQWIDAQLAAPYASLEPYLVATCEQDETIYFDPVSPFYNTNQNRQGLAASNLRHGWWLNALHSSAQLRERAAFALSEIFVISTLDSVVYNYSRGAANYYDMIKRDAFGPFVALLADVSRHPIMGQYLSHLQNQMEIRDTNGTVIVSPDENYAREVMQLFSIGLVELLPDGSLKLGPDSLPIPTYDQTDITELARVFTGWSFSKYNSPSSSTNVANNGSFGRGFGSATFRYMSQWTNPMKCFEDNGLATNNVGYVRYHDNRAKTVLGTAFPAGRTGPEELDAAMALLADHPNTAPFIARRLIQRLVTSNPSAGYIYRAASAFSASGGNLGQVIRAILLDYEARALEPTGAVGYGKKREPIVQYVGLARGLGAKSLLLLSDLSAHGYPTNELSVFPPGTTRVRVGGTTGNLTQNPLEPPSVFNWFLPDFTINGPIAAAGMVAPEFQTATESSVFNTINYFHGLTRNSSGQGGTALPNQYGAPYFYPSNAQNLAWNKTSTNSSPGVAYMSIMDQNGDGTVNSSGDPGTFNNRAKIYEASVKLVDHLDLLLAAGRLRREFAGAPAPNPRQLIIAAVTNTSTFYDDDNNNTTNQALVLRYRMENAAYLISISPQGTIQK
ncbi:MAG: DUF1800 family protein [Verrucomicrobiae bacterium]|nr:DUF1800 family protein [Verrucomicrobiae bacterium]